VSRDRQQLAAYKMFANSHECHGLYTNSSNEAPSDDQALLVCHMRWSSRFHYQDQVFAATPSQPRLLDVRGQTRHHPNLLTTVLSPPLPILLYLLPRTTILNKHIFGLRMRLHVVRLHKTLLTGCLIKSTLSSGCASCVDSNDDGKLSDSGVKSSVTPTFLSPSLRELKMVATLDRAFTCCNNGLTSYVSIQ
jgi:hypothetical protein